MDTPLSVHIAISPRTTSRAKMLKDTPSSIAASPRSKQGLWSDRPRRDSLSQPFVSHPRRWQCDTTITCRLIDSSLKAPRNSESHSGETVSSKGDHDDGELIVDRITVRLTQNHDSHLLKTASTTAPEMAFIDASDNAPSSISASPAMITNSADKTEAIAVAVSCARGRGDAKTIGSRNPSNYSCHPIRRAAASPTGVNPS